MSSVDLDRLKHLAEQGDIQAAQILRTYADRSQDQQLLWYLEGVCRAQLERIAAEMEDWRGLAKLCGMDVVLESCGPNKINCIKVIRELTGRGLKEAKDLAEQTPSILLRAVASATAHEAMSKLIETGAKVRLERSIQLPAI
jgi:ribosomal protein L7/L12